MINPALIGSGIAAPLQAPPPILGEYSWMVAAVVVAIVVGPLVTGLVAAWRSGAVRRMAPRGLPVSVRKTFVTALRAVSAGPRSRPLPGWWRRPRHRAAA